ncbi:hypothetical protein CAPTEDRAFT_210884 [Capitella teleta]|uniref:Uncharacterized protein n=1 Tax=Capitella teleta TaxID=283909 RepID=R7TY73_CAPTE|nr:hypothetical protein CAPTEDRAFT_210884 [Capitella teleta]|eukprot:ELT98838.1 hypothetical protein CAPTEDRAFT_210884 [Capitella teleta]
MQMRPCLLQVQRPELQSLLSIRRNGGAGLMGPLSYIDKVYIWSEVYGYRLSTSVESNILGLRNDALSVTESTMQQGISHSSWEDQSRRPPDTMLTNGPSRHPAQHNQDINEMPSQQRPPNVPHATVRSQDDATVGYFFQRPQPEQYNSKRWAVGDDSAIATVRVSELERDFQGFGIADSREQQMPKKIWDDGKGAGDGGGGPGSKGIFHPPGGDPWTAPREDSWGANPSGVTNPIQLVQRRPGSFPGSGDAASVLSPRSSETSALGVNMAEYVLGGSPVGKDMDGRLHVMKPQYLYEAHTLLRLQNHLIPVLPILSTIKVGGRVLMLGVLDLLERIPIVG